MDVKNQLMHEKTKVLKQIAESAQHGNSQEVLAAGEKLSKIESLLDKYERLMLDISGLDTVNHEARPLPNTRVDSSFVKGKDLKRLDVTSGREIGRTIRADFLKKALEAGLSLEHVKGSIYKTRSGSKVGIAVATERSPDRWFLGLPLEGFDAAVLLCRHETGNTVEICLAKGFFEQFGDMMSQSGGQMKFNVARRGSGYVIVVPGAGGVSVSKFIGDYMVLH